MSPRHSATGPADPLRIGLVGSCYWPVAGGMEMYLRELAAALATEGNDVHVVTRFTQSRPRDVRELHRGVERPRQYDDRGVHVDVVAPGSPRATLLSPVYRLHFRAPALAIRLMSLSLGHVVHEALAGCDVVHFSGAGRELFGFVALRVSKDLGVPLIVTPHTHEGSWGDGELDLRLYRQADSVIATTQDEAGRLERAGVAPEAIHVIGHGVSVSGAGDGARFRAQHGLGDSPMVLYLGRKTPDKGYDLALEAARHLWARVPDARVVLAGISGPERALPEAIDDARVVDLGHIDDSQREDAFAACDVFCLPSQAEAFGLVILEAWSYGKPVVVSDIPTLRERLAGGGGLVVPRNASDFGEALAQLLTDDGLRERHAQVGRAIAAGATWQDTARRMMDVYEAAASARSPVFNRGSRG